jgi:N-acetylmuramoyl-L-alanine amidase
MLKKTFLVLCCFTVTTLLSSFTTNEKKQKVLKTIVIDAGHGGGDVGAKGDYSYEKDICLAVALKLGQEIGRELPDVKLIYTRSNDSYPELHARARQANQNKGDLFISIHVNAAPAIQHKELTGYKNVTSYTGKGKKKKKITKKVPQYRYYSTPNPAKGTETFIWGAHKNEDKEVAIRENAPMLVEENFEQNYGSIDPNSPEFIAVSLLKTKQFFKRSATLSGFVEEQFARVGRISRGQKQRQVGIWVLQATAMPSILVETGYITNRTEEDYLNSDRGQKEIASCITGAVKQYVTWLEKQQAHADANAHVPSRESRKNEASPIHFLEAIHQHEQKRTAVK